MNNIHEDSVDFQSNSQEEKQQPSVQSVLSRGPQEEIKFTKGQAGHSDDECSTDLEDNIFTSSRRLNLSPSDVYLKACKQTGAVPVSYILRHLDDDILDLNYYGLGPLGAKALAILLKSHGVVTHLELKGNSLQAEGTQYLMAMLFENISIQSLNLSDNKLGLKGAEVISTMLSDNPKLKSINLSENDFCDAAAKCLAEALKNDFVVKELDLSYNCICDAGGEDLGVMLAENIGIEVLNLSWNHFLIHGNAALIAGLKVNATLKQLQLSNSGFGRPEVQLMAEVLQQNDTLVLLDLSINCVDDEAVRLLCQGLATNETLEVLKLSRNPMTKIGAATLLRTVKNNMKSALEEIDISSVLVCETFVELLEETRVTHPALRFQYYILPSVTKNLLALGIFKKFFEEQNKSIVDFFQALDKEGTMKVSTSAFRKAVKEANIPLDQQQLGWLVRKFDKNCTATIVYSVVQTFV
ncbi:leucine-rich repeat-containing protein 74A-like isoform X2 [Neolamprologus brichardi]|uniref:leucine-rich repeat-containing protein 74A-like isoform X2 n=1 Tax=Neolamprologus brichardi TaxID=32507 RepID=UPI0003EBC3BF|nr:leucine-rich repeat-containing protein 74A-like isoform X2 [Neolamprologus brichardi]